MKIFRACAVVIAMLVAAGFGLVVIILDDDADADSDGGLGSLGGLKGVPAEFRPWITKASRECKHPELTGALLAAQLNKESHFQTDSTSPKGAQGPAQFIPSSWDTWGRDADGNGEADPNDIGDAVIAQGRYMCSLIGDAKSSGYSGDPRRLALAGYNAGWYAVRKYKGIPPYKETQDYVRRIMATMKTFEGSPDLKVTGSGSGADALRKASGRMGTPYSWGGGGPNGPSTGFCDGTNGYLNGTCSADKTAGFDCSSLVQYSYWPTLKLPRTADAQYGATADRPVSKKDLQPGDLLFWAHRNGGIYHVAIYAGDGKVVHAPRTGRSVELRVLSTAMPAADYYGATRP
ncbi:bifunctional lytic transglycosylase/C40 family peptidase [Streptomyces antimycoticus]|uniref:C40 family peptidase n=1 Tax=Streptomyces antimycoticus TaxID=68175 RepID=UPI003428E67C